MVIPLLTQLPGTGADTLSERYPRRDSGLEGWGKEGWGEGDQETASLAGARGLVFGEGEMSRSPVSVYV